LFELLINRVLKTYNKDQPISIRAPLHNDVMLSMIFQIFTSKIVSYKIYLTLRRSL